MTDDVYSSHDRRQGFSTLVLSCLGVCRPKTKTKSQQLQDGHGWGRTCL